MRSGPLALALRCADTCLGPAEVVASAATARLLDGRAFDRTEGTEDAAVACLRPEQDMTIGAFVEIEACIGGHGFGCHEAAVWTSEGRQQDWWRMHC